MRRLATGILLGFVACAGVATASADEGMWTYDRVPVKLLGERYGMAPDAAWLDHLRLSSVRIGASGSFVTPDGLILTNHHVALGSLQRLSTPERNLVRDGFFAPTRADEPAVPGLAVQVLRSFEDVTPAVERAVKPGASPADAEDRREAARAAIEEDCLKKTGLKGQVVVLYGGAKSVLYRYKEYTDVRLVFAPELQAAFFGGDYDNFTYPRYDLDFAFFRAYEGGKPARVEHYLAVEPKGGTDGDLVFVSGHPGKTRRLDTLAMIEYERDVRLPARLAQLKEQRSLLREYGTRGPEQARRARTRLYFVENSIKASEGELAGLLDPALTKTKRDRESALLAALDAGPGLAGYRTAWSELEQAMAWARDHEKDRLYKLGFGSRTLLGTAIQMVRYAAEIGKPDGERLEGYHESELPDLLRDLQNPPPVYKDFEEALLVWELRRMVQGLGADDPFARTVLEGRTPEETVGSVLAGTQLDDVAFRRGLLEDNGKAIATAGDPLLVLARRVDPALREVRKQFRDHVDAVEEESLASVARAGFAVYGTDAYPDATGTVRLAFGKVAGYPLGTTLVPPFTTFYGLYDRAYAFGNRGDFALPLRAAEHRADVALSTPLNFVSTADITGGNSGSPIVNRAGRLVGLVFDGNRQSHSNTFVYDETEARCVAVDIRAILEALRKVYGAQALADEMLKAAGDPELERLAAWMAGSFSSVAQAGLDADYRDIRLHVVPIWKDRGDGPWLYVEQAAATSPDKPYRQRVYQLARTGTTTVESRVFSLPSPETYVGAWKEPALLGTITPDDLIPRTGCAVSLTPQGDGAFAGSTAGKSCPSEHRGAAYATSEVSITPRGMTSWDRGFDDSGKQVWGADKGAYEFVRD